MAKQRIHKADKKAKREYKLDIERKAEKKFKEAEASSGKAAPHEYKIKPEDRHLLNDFAGPKPKPPKPKGKYSGMSNPPQPPPPLMDMIHNFLKDFKYIKAAHGMRTDNQKRPGHNMTTWKWTSDGYPDLMEIFKQWQEQNPKKIKRSTEDAKMPRRTAGMALGIYGAEEQTLSRKAHQEEVKKQAAQKKKKEEESSSDRDDSDSDDDMSTDKPIEEANDAKPNGKAVNGTKRKASEMSSDSDSDSDSDSGSESGSASDLDSDSADSNSSSDSAPDTKNPAKRRKFGEAPPPMPASSKTKKSKAAASSSSDSDSESAPEQDTEHIGVTNRPNSSGSESESDNEDASSASSSSSSSDSEAEGGVVAISPKSKAQSPKKKSKAKTIDGAADSDSSATLDPAATGTSAKAPYSSSSPSSSDATPAVDEPYVNPARANLRNQHAAQQERKATFHQNAANNAAAKNSTAAPPQSNAAPPTTINGKKQATPFSRIPENFTYDERFGSNKYVPYEYADRAYQDLSVTKGKGFTKEKNKKKRGSYRGGAIDLTGGKGVKFD